MSVPRELQFLVAPQAYPVSLGLGVATLVALALGWTWLAAGAFGLALANLAFFRNPRRTIPAGDHRVLAPADGRVVDVVRLEQPDDFVGPAWRIAIFLSIFNVHINRVPLAGKVRAVRRRGGRFLAAFRSDASERNVQLRLDLEGPNDVRVGVSQITGLIARRIICLASEGGTLERGQPYGLICYGSRVEIYLPIDCEISVRPGQRVRGGSTIIAEVRA